MTDELDPAGLSVQLVGINGYCAKILGIVLTATSSGPCVHIAPEARFVQCAVYSLGINVMSLATGIIMTCSLQGMSMDDAAIIFDPVPG
jgi:hypothetical protein